MNTSFLRTGNGSNAHNAISLNAKASADYAKTLAIGKDSFSRAALVFDFPVPHGMQGAIRLRLGGSNGSR